MNHIPVMLAEVLAALDPKPGEVAVDCTLGAGGHAVEFLRRVGPTGKLIAIDLDPTHVELVRPKLEAVAASFEVHATNFAGLAALVPNGADIVLADLGVSSMQIDDAGRGFSYRRSGPLDLRMNPSRGKTAAAVLQTMTEDELKNCLNELGDFVEFGAHAAAKLAAAIVAHLPIERTEQLTQLILDTVPPPPPPAGKRVKPWQLKYRPVACAFQALRILVNRELANLDALLRSLPGVLKPGGRVAIISFHSGEDRLVKTSFRAGLRAGIYAAVSEEAIRPSPQERYDNPRSRSAKLRWAKRE